MLVRAVLSGCWRRHPGAAHWPGTAIHRTTGRGAVPPAGRRRVGDEPPRLHHLWAVSQLWATDTTIFFFFSNAAGYPGYAAGYPACVSHPPPLYIYIADEKGDPEAVGHLISLDRPGSSHCHPQKHRYKTQERQQGWRQGMVMRKSKTHTKALQNVTQGSGKDPRQLHSSRSQYRLG